MIADDPGRLSSFEPGKPPRLQRRRTPFGRGDEIGAPHTTVVLPPSVVLLHGSWKDSVLSQISDLTIKPPSLDVSAAHSAGYPNRICVVVEQT
jgi:hypothetical protein